MEEKEYKDFAENVEFSQRGVPNHLLLGHGQDLDTFEKRDLATVNYLSFEKRQIP